MFRHVTRDTLARQPGSLQNSDVLTRVTVTFEIVIAPDAVVQVRRPCVFTSPVCLRASILYAEVTPRTTARGERTMIAGGRTRSSYRGTVTVGERGGERSVGKYTHEGRESGRVSRREKTTRS